MFQCAEQRSRMQRTWNLLATALILLVSGCGTVGVVGSGKPATEVRSVNGFAAVELKGTGEVTVEQTGTESLTVTADDNLLQYLTSDVSDGRLTLGTKGTSGISPSTPVLYKISVKSLSELTLAGSGSMRGNKLSTDSLKMVIGGSGDISAEGVAERMEILIAGSGSYKGAGLQTRDAKVEILGSGGAVLAASEKLDVNITGSGSVEYIGDPKVTSRTLGSGSVKKR
jgi:hypothetical protein